MTEGVRAYIGIGSNLDQPLDQVRQALIALESLAMHGKVSASSLYRTRPVGPQDQPDFINAVASFLTHLSAGDLLGGLMEIEQHHGRVRNNLRWGPRTLDLDLLIYGDEVIDEQDLQVPHPRIKERMFVLAPLVDIEPDLVIPGLGDIRELMVCHDDAEIEKIHVDS